jgi:glucose-1-phosphate thymidylyltransferase
MKAIILAAGYATRLYPLTENFPKPLLEVGGKTILDHLIDQLKTITDIDHAYIVTNHRFHGHFTDWARKRAENIRSETQAHTGLRTDILDDGTASNDDRLGAVGDIQFAVEARDITDDAIVLAADNILQFPIQKFVNTFKSNPVSHITVRHNPDYEDRKRRGNVKLDENNKVTEFIEKPEEPISEWSVPPFYIYPSTTLPRIKAYITSGGNPDAPGHFAEWLHKQETVYAYKIEGSVLDIGNHESLAEARAFFESQDTSS